MKPTPPNFVDSSGRWTCIACGACCSFITPLVDNGKLPKEWLGRNGRCTNLQPDNSCRIYETRPDICRIDRSKMPDKELVSMCTIMWKYREQVRYRR